MELRNTKGRANEVEAEINLPSDNGVNTHAAALRLDTESACDVLWKQSSLTHMSLFRPDRAGMTPSSRYS